MLMYSIQVHSGKAVLADWQIGEDQQCIERKDYSFCIWFSENHLYTLQEEGGVVSEFNVY